ncbi:hypothetical protein [Paraglaciecola polaris]|uniref:Uncharacterized protein n=1 Tax=Paraglaciecola polaris LMG 21857 TaxID=1129793 RepID=K6YL09_9ALTE|nr:hypothetical protein [Paraglaciecola polaris]GAC33389.1 hypothetical protein GPLA_2487 [Paraglaciecola polaris LMG 21857]
MKINVLSKTTCGCTVFSTLVFTLGISAESLATTIAYTNDADFDLGVLNSVNYTSPNSNQLQLSAIGETFPILWVANAGEDSVSKIDTDNDCEDARYSTWFESTFHGAYSGPAPSRTAVDVEGNVFVANRHFDGKPASIMKILSEGGIDRNGNGVIDTSVDTNGDCSIDRTSPTEFIPPVDLNSDGILQTNEIADERIAWIVPVGENNGLGRSLCIGTDGNIWVGLFNRREYYKISSVDGSVLSGPIATTGSLTPYGCLVDGDGILWSASLSSRLGILDTNNNTWLDTLTFSGSSYGIAIGNGKVYLGNSGRDFREYDPKMPDDNDPTTGTFTLAPLSNSNFGLSVDGEGFIVGGTSNVTRVDAAGNRLWLTSNPGSSSIGVIPDSKNNVWAVNLSSHNVTKFDKDTGNVLLLKPVGRNPYTYSDATGIAARTVTDPTGIWTVIGDGGAPDTIWDKVSWNTEPEGQVPTGASITVSVRAANTSPELALLPFTPVTNGTNNLAISGRFIDVRTVLRPNDQNESPILSDLVLNTLEDALSCDLDNNNEVNILDINLFRPHRNTPAGPNEPLDIDRNGVINKLDARKCVLECTNSRCAASS